MRTDITSNGMSVFINNLACRGKSHMTVSEEFARIQSPRLVFETNAWMRKFFGHEPNQIFIATDTSMYNEGQCVFMCEEDYQKIKDKFK